MPELRGRDAATKMNLILCKLLSDGPLGNILKRCWEVVRSTINTYQRIFAWLRIAECSVFRSWNSRIHNNDRQTLHSHQRCTARVDIQWKCQVNGRQTETSTAPCVDWAAAFITKWGGGRLSGSVPQLEISHPINKSSVFLLCPSPPTSHTFRSPISQNGPPCCRIH